MAVPVFKASSVVRRLIPMLDRVLVQRHEPLTKTKGGIVIPEKAQVKVLRGVVVAVGPGSRNQVHYLKNLFSFFKLKIHLYYPLSRMFKVLLLKSG